MRLNMLHHSSVLFGRPHSPHRISVSGERTRWIILILRRLAANSRAKKRSRLPTAAYNVSGEFSMIKAAAREGWLDEKSAIMEVLTSIKRAGADMILTYHAMEAAEWLG